MTDAAIAPCPFPACRDADPAIDEVAPGVHALVCQGCGCIGPHDPNVKQTAEEAVRRWNEGRA